MNGKIDTGGLHFEPVLEDVETLNEWALAGKLDITKLSFPAFFQSCDTYVLLNAGSALGKGVGPLLISGKEIRDAGYAIRHARIAIPGMNTTANLLLSFAFPEAKNKVPMIFSSIEDAVLKGETDLGVIIHENRFTYQDKGLIKVLDLGEYWEEKMKIPIPLGGIAIKRSIDRSVALSADRLIRKSLEYAFAHYPLVTDYVKKYSQTMSEKVMRQHIDLYVNDYSLDLGKEGKNAVTELYKVFSATRSPDENNISSSQLFIS